MAIAKSKERKHGVSLLDKYELGRLLDHGNFTKVYHTCCLADSGAVAVKVLDKPGFAATGMDMRVLGEVSAMRHLRHPNVLRLHKVLATRFKVYLVMELAPGGDLLSRLTSLPARQLPESTRGRTTAIEHLGPTTVVEHPHYPPRSKLEPLAQIQAGAPATVVQEMAKTGVVTGSSDRGGREPAETSSHAESPVVGCGKEIERREKLQS